MLSFRGVAAHGGGQTGEAEGVGRRGKKRTRWLDIVLEFGPGGNGVTLRHDERVSGKRGVLIADAKLVGHLAPGATVQAGPWLIEIEDRIRIGNDDDDNDERENVKTQVAPRSPHTHPTQAPPFEPCRTEESRERTTEDLVAIFSREASPWSSTSSE